MRLYPDALFRRLMRALPEGQVRMTCRLLCILLIAAVGRTAQAADEEYPLAVEKTPLDQTPAGWVAAATHASGPLAGWGVTLDRSSSGQPNRSLTLVKIRDASSSVFNLFWTRQVLFLDGELNVQMRANSGAEDQGGGLIWRVKDENNYYVARYNPLENNFRLYYVKAGSRTQLATREGLKSAPGEWVNLRIAHHGQYIQGWFQGKLAWQVSDVQFLNGGGVGLWTKADAASSFSDFALRRTASDITAARRNE